MKTKRKPFGKKHILERDNYQCQYCGAETTGIDHIDPYSFVQKHDPRNMVACCNQCNSIASNFLFRNFIEKKNYILAKKLQRNLKITNPNFYPDFIGNKCLNCENTFYKNRAWQKFCSTSCRIEHWRKTHSRISSQELKEIEARLNILESHIEKMEGRDAARHQDKEGIPSNGVINEEYMS